MSTPASSATESPLRMTERLRRETRPEHDLLEQRISFERLTTSLNYYREVLRTFYGFYRPLEQQLAQFCSKALQTNLLTCRASRALQNDLRALGSTESELRNIALCEDVPQVQCTPALWGCMYVLEGSTLGGVVISRQIGERLEITNETGGEFFTGHGDQTGLMWRQFRSELDFYAENVAPDMNSVILHGAVQTFQCLRRWLDQRLPSP